MSKNNIPLIIALILTLSGCVSTMETDKEAVPVPKSYVGMSTTEIVGNLNDPDFVSSFEGQTIFFYCTYVMNDPLKDTCTPIFFKNGTVVYVGEEDAEKWKLNTVLFKVAADKKKLKAKKETKKEKDVTPFGRTKTAGGTIREDSIKVETLTAQAAAYTPAVGDIVYVSYYTNVVRYIPLRSIPSKNGEILKTLCLGSELGVLSVKDKWLYVHGIDENFEGWVLKHWVTNDRTVKLDAENMRTERAPEIERLEAIVKPIPRSKWRDNLKLYEQLLALDPCNTYYQRKVEFYEKYGGKRKKRKRR
jgi:hypothetical protein